MPIVTSRINMGGLWYNRRDIRRGDTPEVPTQDEAAKIVAQGLADHGKVKPENLSPAYKEDTEALKVIMQRFAAQNHNPEFDPKPNVGPVVSPYRSKFTREGWGA